MLKIRNMDLEEAKAIAGWRYPAPYDVYDFSDWQTMKAAGWAITIPEKRAAEFRTLWENGRLTAWFHLFTKPGTNELFLGLGLAPALCGQGKGVPYVKRMVEYALAENKGSLYLEVREFNRRAIRCYQAVGFREDTRYKRNVLGESCRMIRMVYRV